MDNKLKATPKHIAEFINYTMAFHEECSGLNIKPEDITKVVEGDVNWTVDFVNKTGVSKEGAQTLSRIVDMHAEIIDVHWDD